MTDAVMESWSLSNRNIVWMVCLLCLLCMLACVINFKTHTRYFNHQQALANYEAQVSERDHLFLMQNRLMSQASGGIIGQKES